MTYLRNNTRCHRPRCDQFKPWLSLCFVVSCRPKELGEAPSSRFRHTAVLVDFPPDSELHDALHAALSSLGVDATGAAAGSLVLLYGGYNTRGEEFGGPNIQVTPEPSAVHNRSGR